MNYSLEVKARVARDAIRKKLTLAALSKKSGVQSGQISP
jgi:transposase-like protein